MANKIKKTIHHEPTGAGIIIELDYNDVTVYETMRGVVDFWSGSEKRLKENNNKYLDTFLKMLCEECMVMGLKDKSSYEIIEIFRTKEGWCNIDGSSGIKLLHVIAIEINSQSDFIITDLQTSRTTKNEKFQ